jgi:hypothetical protein
MVGTINAFYQTLLAMQQHPQCAFHVSLHLLCNHLFTRKARTTIEGFGSSSADMPSNLKSLYPYYWVISQFFAGPSNLRSLYLHQWVVFQFYSHLPSIINMVKSQISIYILIIGSFPNSIQGALNHKFLNTCEDFLRYASFMCLLNVLSSSNSHLASL